MILVIFCMFHLFLGVLPMDWKIDINDTSQEEFEDIRKCCQMGEVLDSWYKCTPFEDVHQNFTDELSYLVGYDNESLEGLLTVIPKFQCPRSKIREYIAMQLHSDGYIDIIEDVFENINSSSNDYYCIEMTEIQGQLEGIHAVFCNQNRARMLEEENTGFLTKCCPQGKILDGYFDDCVDLPKGISDRDWIPPRMIHSELSARPTGQYFVNISHFPDICHESKITDVIPEYFYTNGLIILDENGTYSQKQYTCADRVLVGDSEVSDAMALICEFENPIGVFETFSCKNVDLRPVYTFFGIISILCLLATLAVYLKLPTLQNLHGKIVISNIISILATTVLFLTILNRQAGHQDSGEVCENLDKFCAFKGYLLYYFSIAMFSWMSVMCFDLSWRFIRIRLPSQGSEKKKLWSYSAFCWGLPLIFLLFAVCCQFSLPHDSNFNPNIGCDHCFIQSDGSRLLIFFHLPIFFMIIANIVGFVITAYSMYKAKSGTKKATLSRRTNSMRQSTTERRKSGKRKSLIPEKAMNQDTLEQMVMYGKMFLVLGIPWVFEGIHFFSHQRYQHGCHPGGFSETFFRIISIFNFSRGIFLFLIFVCKRPVWKELQKIKWIHDVTNKFIRTKTNTAKSMETLDTDVGGKVMMEEDEQTKARTSSSKDENAVEIEEKSAKQRSTNLIQSTRV